MAGDGSCSSADRTCVISSLKTKISKKCLQRKRLSPIIWTDSVPCKPRLVCEAPLGLHRFWLFCTATLVIPGLGGLLMRHLRNLSLAEEKPSNFFNRK